MSALLCCPCQSTSSTLSTLSIIGEGVGIHWPEIDEYIHVSGVKVLSLHESWIIVFLLFINHDNSLDYKCFFHLLFHYLALSVTGV